MATFIYPPAGNVTITGAATEATLSALNAKIPGPLGQHVMAASLSVTIASDQSPIAVTTTPAVTDFGVTTNAERIAAVIGNTTGAVAYGAGASSAQTLRVIEATDSTLAKSVQLPAGLGNTTMANSLPVTLASDQGVISVGVSGIGADFGVSSAALRVASLIGNATGVAAFNSGVTNAQTLRVIPATDSNLAKAAQFPTTLGQTTAANSLSVAIASDQLPLSISLSGSALNYGVATAALRTAAQIGNASGVADFGSGTTSAQTIRVVPATDSNLSKAAQLPSALGQTTSVNSLSVTIASDQSAVPVSLGLPADFGTSTTGLRVAALLGNSTGMASFGAGTTSAQTLRVIEATDSTLAKSAQFPTTLGQTTAAGSLSVAIASDQVPLSTNSKARYSRVQAPVLLDAGNIAASGGTRYLVATASAEITRLVIRDATGLFINWYSAAAAGTLLFQTGPGLEVPFDIVIANGTTLYVESATSTAGTSGAYMSINFLS